MRRWPVQMWSVVLALLALSAFSVSQTVALTPGHSDEHGSHCCAMCHAGHSVVVQQAAAAVKIAAPTAPAVAGVVTADFACFQNPFALERQSRAPPALSFTV